MSERKFFIHNLSEIVQEEAAISGKVAANVRKGERDYLSGAIDPFRSHSKELQDRTFIVTPELDSKSALDMTNRIIEPLSSIMASHGIAGVFAGRGDIKPHLTLQPLVMEGMSDRQVQETLEDLRENRYLQMVGKILNGVEFDLDRVVAVGRDVILCAGEFNSDLYPLYKARQLIRRVYKRHASQIEESEGSLDPQNYDDIVHVTVGRITGFPLGLNVQSLEAFGVDVEEKINRQIEKEPIHVTIGSVFEGQSSEFIETRGGFLA